MTWTDRESHVPDSAIALSGLGNADDGVRHDADWDTALSQSGIIASRFGIAALSGIVPAPLPEALTKWLKPRTDLL